MLETNWATHDFSVKLVDWSAARGSRLAYSCRRCGRKFYLFSLQSRDPWAIDAEGRPLDSMISNRWLAEECPRSFSAGDDEDRKHLSKSGAHS
jgi:hypothetical protein